MKLRNKWKKRFDVNGDGVLDEAEKHVGRRIMTEIFLENHADDLHLYGQGLAQNVSKHWPSVCATLNRSCAACGVRYTILKCNRAVGLQSLERWRVCVCEGVCVGGGMVPSCNGTDIAKVGLTMALAAS